MKRWTALKIYFISVFLLSGITAGSPPADAAVLTVGPGEIYTAIQDAVDAAAPGDTIQVRAGNYVEDIRISTNDLVLVSVDGSGLAVIEGAGTADWVVYVDTDLGVTVDGFRFLPGPTGIWGIYHNGGAPVTDITITGNIFEDFSSRFDSAGFRGVWFYMTGADFTFTGNTMTRCQTGTYVSGFEGCTIRINGNSAENCINGLRIAGLDFNARVTDAEIIGNRVTRASLSGFGETGIFIQSPEDTTRISDNTVRGPYMHGISIDNLGDRGREPAVVFVERNFISGSEYGLYFDDLVYDIPAEVTVRFNVVNDVDYGIYTRNFSYASHPLTSVLFRGNSIEDASLYGFFNVSTELVDAGENWWGDASGPFDDKTLPGTPDYNNPAGTGSRVSEYVDYRPWQTEQPGPARPVLLSPADGSTGVSLTPTLETEPFFSEMPFFHASTMWQVGTAADLTSGMMIDSASMTQLTSFAVPPGGLAPGTRYYWRVRFADSGSVLSEWSDIWSFTTGGSSGGGGGGGCSAGSSTAGVLLLLLPLMLVILRK